MRLDYRFLHMLSYQVYVLWCSVCRVVSNQMQCNATVECGNAMQCSATKCKPVRCPSPEQYQGTHLAELWVLHILRHVNTSVSLAGRIMTPQYSMWLTWKDSWQNMMAAAALSSGSNKVLAISTSRLGQPVCHCRTCYMAYNQS